MGEVCWLSLAQQDLILILQPFCTTTAFRRIAYVLEKTCPIAADIETAASNVVTITVNTTALPVISFVSGAINDVMCEGDDLTFDASGTTGANFFQFFINGTLVKVLQVPLLHF